MCCAGGACEGVLCEAKWLDWDHVYPLTDATDSSSDPGSESESEGERERGVRVGEEGGEGEEDWRKKGWVCAPIETLLASDVIHDESCARGMARLIRLALKDDGTWGEGKWRELRGGCAVCSLIASSTVAPPSLSLLLSVCVSCVYVVCVGVALVLAPCPQVSPSRYSLDLASISLLS